MKDPTEMPALTIVRWRPLLPSFQTVLSHQKIPRLRGRSKTAIVGVRLEEAPHHESHVCVHINSETPWIAQLIYVAMGSLKIKDLCLLSRNSLLSHEAKLYSGASNEPSWWGEAGGLRLQTSKDPEQEREQVTEPSGDRAGGERRRGVSRAMIFGQILSVIMAELNKQSWDTNHHDCA